MTRPQVAALLARIKVLWPNTPVTGDTAEVWHEMLAGEPYDGALEALTRIVKTSEWAPSIALLLETQLAMGERHHPTYTERALPSGERLASAETNAAWLAKIRAELPALTKRVP